MNDTTHWISGTHRNVLLFEYNAHVLITQDAKLYSEMFCEEKI